MKNSETKEFFDKLANDWKHSKEEEQYAKKLIQEIGINKDDKVLDIACGDGIVTGFEFQESSYPVTAVDLSPEMIKKAKEKFGDETARFYCVDLFDFVEKGYDYAVMYNCYPHFIEPEKLSWKVASLLADGGKLAIIHSQGRDDLNKIHKNNASHVSRQLCSPEEEANYFKSNFNTVKCEEDSDHFLLILEKK